MVEEGYSAETASTAQEGLELIRKKQFDVVLLDVDMQGLGGINTVKKLSEDHPSMRVIIVHKYDTAVSGLEGLGCVALIKHPSFERILLYVKRALAATRD